MDCGHRTIPFPLRFCRSRAAATLVLTVGLLLVLGSIAVAQTNGVPAPPLASQSDDSTGPGEEGPTLDAYGFPVQAGKAPGEVSAGGTASAESAALEAMAAIVGSLNYAGMMLAVGGIAFLLMVHDRRSGERGMLTGLVMVGVALAAGGSVLGVFVQGPFVTGLGIGAMLDPAMLSTVLATSYGDAVVVRLTGLGVILIALPYLWSRWAVVTSSIAGCAIIASFVISATYSSELPYWLVVAASLSHKLAAAAWFGGLILLLAAMRQRRARNDVMGGARLVARFSLFATASIVFVTAAGLGMTWARVPTTGDLFTTSYGLILMGKVVLFGVVLAIGGYNHHFLVPAIERGRRAVDAWKKMERLIRFEVVGIVAVVLATVALIQFAPAPRDSREGAFTATADLGGGHRVELAVSARRAGWGDVQVLLLGPDGQPLDDATGPTLALYRPAGEVAPVQGAPEKVGPGAWLLRDQKLPQGGDWLMAVRLRTSSSEQLTAEVPVALAR